MKKSNEWKETNTIDIKRIITEEIAHFVARADQADGIKRWRTPLVGFADVQSPEIRNLKVAAGEKHLFPEDIMEDARIVIAYFIPFEEKLFKRMQREKWHRRVGLLPMRLQMPCFQS